MARSTTKSKKYQQSAFEDPTVTDIEQCKDAYATAKIEPIASVEDEYNRIIEKAGLNMPMLLQAILKELMLLRAGK